MNSKKYLDHVSDDQIRHELEEEIEDSGIQSYLNSSMPDDSLPGLILEKLPDQPRRDNLPRLELLAQCGSESSLLVKILPLGLSAAAMFLAIFGIMKASSPAIAENTGLMEAANIELAMYRYRGFEENIGRIHFNQKGMSKEIDLSLGQRFLGHCVVDIRPEFIAFDSDEGEHIVLYAAQYERPTRRALK